VKIVKSGSELRDARKAFPEIDTRLAFIPTMGSLHRGHLELIKFAAERSDRQLVSIFVNPTQFNEESDYERYPRTVEGDLEILQAEGVDIVFVPDVSEIYPAASKVRVSVQAGKMAEGL